LNTTTETKTVAGEKESQQVKGLLIQFAFHLKKEGISENTITTYIRFLQKLNKHANLEDPESVKTALATMNICENTKVVHCYAYDAFLKFLGKTWKKPKYQHRQKLPEFIPTTEEIEQLIAGLSKKMGTLITLIKETGMRISECLSIEWTALDFQNNVITLVNAKKNSLPRVFKVSNTCMNKLGNLPRKHSKVFGTMSRKNATWNLITARKRIAARTANPRIAKIHFHLIRHYFGTLLYHKTKDMDYVRRQMGHKSILNTQMYVNMEQALFTASNKEYYVKVASTVEEALKLVEVGFEYVTDMNEKKIFRKRK
jgi:integrase